MKRIVFLMDSGYVGAERRDVFEFPDGATEEQISAAFTDWILQYGEWWDVADGGEEESE